MSSSPRTSTRERFIAGLTAGGADDPDQLIGVAAGELLEWGWLLGALADWLTHAGTATATATATAADYDAHFAGHPTREAAAWMLDHIAERIGGLLDGDRGQS
jgi:hypothetical protein